MAEAIGLDDARGAMVTEVMDGPSKEAGILAGDVILEFDGGNVADSNMLVRRVSPMPALGGPWMSSCSAMAR